MIRPSALSTLAAAAVVLAACSGILPTDETRDDTYRLTPPAPQAVAGAAAAAGAGAGAPDATLVIDDVAVAAGLETDRIAVWEDPRKVEYYAGARWVDEPAEMVRSALVEAFRASGAVKAVGQRSVALDPDYRLRARISDFEAGYRPGQNVPTVQVVIAADLLAEPAGRVIASRTFSEAFTPTSDRLPDVVRAFDAAADAAITDMVTWAATEMR